MNIHSQFVEVRGERFHVLSAGQGPVLLLLHGWPEWSHIWRPMMHRLADRYTLIAPDFRGFGDSPMGDGRPAHNATPDLLANDTLAILDALGVARFGVVAHDVGSFVGQVIARKVPQRISGLFFFNCAYPGIGARWVAPRHVLQTWYQFFHQQPWAGELIGSSRDTCRVYLREMIRHWSFKKDAFDNQLEVWVDQFMKPGALQGGFNWYLSNHENRMRIIEGAGSPPPPIALPTRIFWGAHDPVFLQSWTDRLGEFFTDLEFGFAQKAGHFVHVEMPGESEAAIDRFFYRIGWRHSPTAATLPPPCAAR